jgi:hypothetical protein
MRFLMRLRTWIGILAAMGMVWHGGLPVRHSVAMADALRHYRALLADMTSLCRTRRGATSNAASDLPTMPLPPDDAADCLVCTGLVGAVIPTPQPLTRPAPAAPAVSSAEAEAARMSPLRVAHPPARGPPPGA